MSTFIRQATVVAKNASRIRAFSSSTIARKDLVQDLYLRELRTYKAPPQAKDAHVGVVKSYSLPPAPKPPVLPTDLASELSAYEAAELSLAESPAAETTTTASASGTNGATTDADAFLSLLEQDLPKAEAHH